MKSRILSLLLTMLALSACATTMPTVEDGWVPLDEWNHRIVHAPMPRSWAAAAEGVKNGGSVPRSPTVRTYCQSYTSYTHCASYAR